MGFYRFALYLTSGVPTDSSTLGGSIEAQFAALPNLQALLSSPRLWHIEADLDEQLPYVTFFASAAERELTTGDPFVTDFVVQWSFHAASAQEAQSIAQAFMQKWPNGFDRAPLSINGQQVAVAQFEDSGITTIGEGKGPGGKDCYMHIAMYQVMQATSRS